MTSEKVALGRNSHCASIPTEGKAEKTAWRQVSGELRLVRAFGSSLQTDLTFLVK